MTSILVDTHIALWAIGAPERLTDWERAVLTDRSIDRVLSPMSIWEAAIKREAGRLTAPRHLSVILEAQFRMLPLDSAVLEIAAELPAHHADPFDRVLIAHALTDDLRVLTRDAAFACYGVQVVDRPD